MRAVNLIPSESGRGGAGGSVGPYAVLAVLALALAFAIAYVLTDNAVKERRAEAASLRTQAQAAQAQAAALRPYVAFASLAEARVKTVRELGRARFDWNRAFTELARVLPENVWLTSLLGTVTTGVSVEGAGSGTTSSVRGALPNPAIELQGCTTGQAEVARLISRLRLMTGVVRVSLADSVKLDAAGGASGGGAGDSAQAGGDSGDCRNGDPTLPQFGVVVFFETLPTPAAPADPAASATPVAVESAAPEPTPAATGGSSGSDVR